MPYSVIYYHTTVRLCIITQCIQEEIVGLVRLDHTNHALVLRRQTMDAAALNQSLILILSYTTELEYLRDCDYVGSFEGLH